MNQREDGQRHRARIVQLLEDHDANVNKNPTKIKFLCSVNNDQCEEVIAYNEILQFLEKDEEDDVVWKFKSIIGHEGPLTAGNSNYNGSSYNLRVEWETGEITSEPLDIIAKDDPVSCAVYAKENNLSDTPGWKRFKSIARRQKKLLRMVKQAKLQSYKTAPKYLCGYEVPKNYEHAMALDHRNGNKKWQEAIDLERNQINDYETFKDMGHHTVVQTPLGYKKIRVHLVFSVKHDGRHKARLVADGHLTDAPLSSVYSGVVSLNALRIAMFLAELNELEIWATDIGNAYLEAKTKEKV